MSSQQDQSQLLRWYWQRRDSINEYHQINSLTSNRQTTKIQQTLHSWRIADNNYTNTQLSFYCNTTSNNNNETPNGSIDHITDNTVTSQNTNTPPTSNRAHTLASNNIENSNEKRRQQVLHSNNGQRPSRTKHQRYGDCEDNIITSEYINVHGIHPHDEFIE